MWAGFKPTGPIPATARTKRPRNHPKRNSKGRWGPRAANRVGGSRQLCWREGGAAKPLQQRWGDGLPTVCPRFCCDEYHATLAFQYGSFAAAAIAQYQSALRSLPLKARRMLTRTNQFSPIRLKLYKEAPIGLCLVGGKGPSPLPEKRVYSFEKIA